MAEHKPQTPEQVYDAALKQLKGMQRKFVLEYLVDFHGQNAAIRAGYSAETARSQASRLLTIVNIQEAIQAGMTLQSMPASEVLARLSAHARGSMGDFLRVDEEEVTITWSLLELPVDEEGKPKEGDVLFDLAMRENVKPTDRVLKTATVKRSVARLDLLAAGAAGKLNLVKKYTVDKEGKETIELYDAQAALVQLGKAHRLFIERTEHTGPNGGPITVAAEDLAEARRKAAQFEQETFGE